MWKLYAAMLLTFAMAGDATNVSLAQEKKPLPHDGYYKILPDGKVKPSLPKAPDTRIIPEMGTIPGIARKQAQRERFNRMAEKFPIHRVEKDPGAYTMQYRPTPDFRSSAKEPSWEPNLPKRKLILDATQIAPIHPNDKSPKYFRMLPKAPRNQRP